MDESQVVDGKKLQEKLRYELEILMAYQSKNKMQAEAQRNRERMELEDRVAVRRSLLKQKVTHHSFRFLFRYFFLFFELYLQMDQETQQFSQERSERIRLLHERQNMDLEQFDEESARLGFR